MVDGGKGATSGMVRLVNMHVLVLTDVQGDGPLPREVGRDQEDGRRSGTDKEAGRFVSFYALFCCCLCLVSVLLFLTPLTLLPTNAVSRDPVESAQHLGGAPPHDPPRVREAPGRNEGQRRGISTFCLLLSRLSVSFVFRFVRMAAVHFARPSSSLLLFFCDVAQYNW